MPKNFPPSASYFSTFSIPTFLSIFLFPEENQTVAELRFLANLGLWKYHEKCEKIRSDFLLWYYLLKCGKGFIFINFTLCSTTWKYSPFGWGISFLLGLELVAYVGIYHWQIPINNTVLFNKSPVNNTILSKMCLPCQNYIPKVLNYFVILCANVWIHFHPPSTFDNFEIYVKICSSPLKHPPLWLFLFPQYLLQTNLMLKMSLGAEEKCGQENSSSNQEEKRDKVEGRGRVKESLWCRKCIINDFLTIIAIKMCGNCVVVLSRDKSSPCVQKAHTIVQFICECVSSRCSMWTY